MIMIGNKYLVEWSTRAKKGVRLGRVSKRACDIGRTKDTVFPIPGGETPNTSFPAE